MRRALVVVLSVVLGLLILAALGAQVLIPMWAAELAKQYPEFSHLAAPYSVGAVAALLCGQVALGLVLRLLLQVRRGTIFTAPTAKTVTGIIWCLGIATALSAIVAGYHVIEPGAGSPFSFLLTTVLALTGAAATIIMVILRDLLSTATEYRGELDGVI